LDLEKGVKWVETKTGFFADGKLYSMSNSVEFLLFPPLNLLDKFRLAITILYASRLKDWRRLESITVSDWLRTWSGNHTFEKIWLPLLRSKLGESYKVTSAAFIWATIARMYAARRTGLKKEMFGYVPGGYARVLERFREMLLAEDVLIKLAHTGRQVERDGRSGIRVTFQNGSVDAFDRVVLTVPAPMAGRLCPQLNADERSRLEQSRYQGIICASLLLEHPLSEFYVTNITDVGIPFTAVIEMSALVDRKLFGGKALVYLPKYLSPDDPAFSLTDDEIRDLFLSTLVRMYPHFSRKRVLATRISRVRHVFPLPTLNRSERLPPVVTSVPGLYIVNSAQIVNATLAVNETIQLAERAFKEILSGSERVLPASVIKEAEQGFVANHPQL
jgi:protoporphyrinogen oxidase